MRRSIQRRTVDYNASTIQMMKVRKPKNHDMEHMVQSPPLTTLTFPNRVLWRHDSMFRSNIVVMHFYFETRITKFLCASILGAKVCITHLIFHVHSCTVLLLYVSGLLLALFDIRNFMSSVFLYFSPVLLAFCCFTHVEHFQCTHMLLLVSILNCIYLLFDKKVFYFSMLRTEGSF